MTEIKVFISSVQAEFAKERNNPILATPMYLAGYIERIGTGTTDVMDVCEEMGLAAPVFEQDENFRATIFRRNVGQNVGQNSAENQHDAENVGQNVGLSKKAERFIKILNTLLTNRRTPQREIANMLSVSERTINRDLNEIRKTYRVEWIGASKTGRWEIEKRK